MIRVALIGPRGGGKSLVAKILGELMEQEVFCLDKIIEKTHQTTISQMVSQNGWEYFRDMEEQTLNAVSKKSHGILDCGGGIVERERNRILLAKSYNLIAYLTGSPQVLVDRISGDRNRPPLTLKVDPFNEMVYTLEKRAPLYREIANLVINTDGIGAREIAEIIFKKLVGKAS